MRREKTESLSGVVVSALTRKVARHSGSYFRPRTAGVWIHQTLMGTRPHRLATAEVKGDRGVVLATLPSVYRTAEIM